jgi:ubiquinone/menaquinone biosynthesis C-methylase UbiE
MISTPVFSLRGKRLLQLAAVCSVLVSPVHAQIERTARDGWQKVDEIFAAMGVREGSRVADIGAGGGFLTIRLSVAVGNRGKVYAEDVSQGSMRQLRQQVGDLGLQNVEPVLGEPDDPKLPAGELDAVVMVNAYHEMNEHEAMLACIWRALRGGGRVVIVDNPPRDSTASRDRQMRAHDLHIGVAEQDLRTAGFEILQRRPDFIETGSGRRRQQQWMLVAVKPS